MPRYQISLHRAGAEIAEVLGTASVDLDGRPVRHHVATVVPAQYGAALNRAEAWEVSADNPYRLRKVLLNARGELVAELFARLEGE